MRVFQECERIGNTVESYVKMMVREQSEIYGWLLPNTNIATCQFNLDVAAYLAKEVLDEIV